MAKRKNQVHDPVEEGLEAGEIGEFFDSEEEGEDLALNEGGESSESDEETAEEEEDIDVLVDDDILIDEEPEEEVNDPFAWFTDTAGYNENYDWSGFDPEEKARHEELLVLTPETVGKQGVTKLSGLDRWAVAQSYLRLGQPAKFMDVCRAILKMRSKHEALAHDEIYLELIASLAENGEHEEAFKALDRFLKLYPHEEAAYQRVRGLLLIESGKIHDGKELLDGTLTGNKQQGELLLEIGDELVALGHPELALNYLKRGKRIARIRKDPELITEFDESMRLANQQAERND